MTYYTDWQAAAAVSKALVDAAVRGQKPTASRTAGGFDEAFERNYSEDFDRQNAYWRKAAPLQIKSFRL